MSLICNAGWSESAERSLNGGKLNERLNRSPLLSKALDTARLEMPERTQQALLRSQRQKASGIAGGTNRAPDFLHPSFTFVDAEAATATPADGQCITDFLHPPLQDYLAFSPKPVIDAVSKAMAHGHALGEFKQDRGDRSGRFVDRFEAMEMVRFSNTGSEANTYAINTRGVPSLDAIKILMYEGAYHGAYPRRRFSFRHTV